MFCNILFLNFMVFSYLSDKQLVLPMFTLSLVNISLFRYTMTWYNFKVILWVFGFVVSCFILTLCPVLLLITSPHLCSLNPCVLKSCLPLSSCRFVCSVVVLFLCLPVTFSRWVFPAFGSCFLSLFLVCTSFCFCFLDFSCLLIFHFLLHFWIWIVLFLLWKLAFRQVCILVPLCVMWHNVSFPGFKDLCTFLSLSDGSTCFNTCLILI